MRSPARREFVVGAAGAVASLVSIAALPAISALSARVLVAQQQPQTNFVPMDESAYRPVYKVPKPGAAPLLDDAARDALEKRLKCQCPCILDVYTCRTTDFSCGVSPAMHRDVMRLIAGGYGEQEIFDAFVEVYGEVALTEPVKQGFNWLGYFAPAIVLATGATLLTMMLRRWSVESARNRSASVASSTASTAAGTATGGATEDEMERLKRVLREEG